MIKFNTYLLLVYTLIIITLWGCIAAGGTDVDSALVEGEAVMSGSPVASARVYIMTAVYNPVAGDTINPPQEVVTGPSGRFQFKVAPGVYSIEVRNSPGVEMAWTADITLKQGANESLSLELAAPGVMVFPIPADMAKKPFYIYIPGSNVYAMNDTASTSGSIMLGHVPRSPISQVLMGDMSNMAKPPETFHEDIPMFMQDTLYMH